MYGGDSPIREHGRITGRFRLRDHARALAKDPEAIKNVFSLEEA
jgi:hypothetical protein